MARKWNWKLIGLSEEWGCQTDQTVSIRRTRINGSSTGSVFFAGPSREYTDLFFILFLKNIYLYDIKCRIFFFGDYIFLFQVCDGHIYQKKKNLWWPLLGAESGKRNNPTLKWLLLWHWHLTTGNQKYNCCVNKK